MYVKKDRYFDSTKPYRVIELTQRSKSGKGSTVWAVLDDEQRTKIRISDLTDTPCHIMTCSNCKYHK